jgi:hypothetical protein
MSRNVAFHVSHEKELLLSHRNRMHICPSSNADAPQQITARGWAMDLSALQKSDELCNHLVIQSVQ